MFSTPETSIHVLNEIKRNENGKLKMEKMTVPVLA